jgi:hypothetical protein
MVWTVKNIEHELDECIHAPTPGNEKTDVLVVLLRYVKGIECLHTRGSVRAPSDFAKVFLGCGT